MKRLTNLKASIAGNRVTITGDIVEQHYSSFFGKQQTVLHATGPNLQYHAHLQLTDQAMFIKVPGKQCGVAIEKADFVELAKAIEPRLHFGPVAVASLTAPLTVNINSELTPDLQWQSSPDGTTWTDVAGQTTNKLDRTKVKPGERVRLRASSDAGECYSNAVIV